MEDRSRKDHSTCFVAAAAVADLSPRQQCLERAEREVISVPFWGCVQEQWFVYVPEPVLELLWLWPLWMLLKFASRPAEQEAVESP